MHAIGPWQSNPGLQAVGRGGGSAHLLLVVDGAGTAPRRDNVATHATQCCPLAP